MKPLYYVLIPILFGACSPDKLPETNHHSDYHFSKVEKSAFDQTEQVYIPIYSDVYYVDSNHTFPLTATLSIRNTSFKDSIYVLSIDYYNSEGKKVRRYNNSTLLVKPMESVEFVVEEKDDTGGVGANFVVEWGARAEAQRPYFHGVMIGTFGQQGISFTTEGIVIKQ
ncbi:MAG TPA: DUF3124 domain-containing protein [Prolixibacteraceae bacterium]|nr:DUF3124 domain-containing protein [Prolixibacteraceae bacterium]